MEVAAWVVVVNVVVAEVGATTKVTKVGGKEHPNLTDSDPAIPSVVGATEEDTSVDSASWVSEALVEVVVVALVAAPIALPPPCIA